MLHSRVDRRRALSLGEQSYPSYPRLYPLHRHFLTLGHQFVDVVNEFQSEDDVVANVEVNSHAVKGAFFNGELSHLLLVMVAEVKLDVTMRASLAHQLDFHYFHLSRLVFFQLLLLDVAQ